MFVDGEELLSDPASVMDQVQHFLNLHSILDYAKILRFVSFAHLYMHMVSSAYMCTHAYEWMSTS